MKITFAHVHIDGSRFAGEDPNEVLDMDSDPEFRPCSALKYDLFAQPSGEDLLVRGSLSADFQACCGKCATDFIFTARVANFTRVYRARNKSDVIDLTCDMREDTILALPSIAVCSASCRGLCPDCGKNLNNGKCACADAPAKAPWSVFDMLYTKGIDHGSTKKKNLKKQNQNT